MVYYLIQFVFFSGLFRFLLFYFSATVNDKQQEISFLFSTVFIFFFLTQRKINILFKQTVKLTYFLTLLLSP